MPDEMHTARCQAAQAVERAWWERWPGACRTCAARGWIEGLQAHPYGSTVAYEPTSDPCPACTDAALCPRCGLRTWDDGPVDEDAWCSACGAPLLAQIPERIAEVFGYSPPGGIDLWGCECHPCAVCRAPTDFGEPCGKDDDAHRQSSITHGWQDDRRAYTRGE